MSALLVAWLAVLMLIGGDAGPPAPQSWGVQEPPKTGGQGGRPVASSQDDGSRQPLAVRQDAPTAATPEQLAALRDVLARPEFGAAAGRGLLDRLLDPVRSLARSVLGEAIRLLGRLLSGSGGEAVGYATVAVGLAVTVAAGLVVRRLLRGALATEAALAGDTTTRPPRADEELAHARTLAEAGDLRAAVHHRYLAVLRHLDERGLLRFDRALTNRELLPRVPADAAIAAALAPLVARFDRLWYSQATCSREEYDELARLADRVWEAAA